MITKINGAILDGTVTSTFGDRLKAEMWGVPVPNIQHWAPAQVHFDGTINGVLVQIDNLNYYMMSQTQMTELLYRYMHEDVKAIYEMVSPIFT